MLSSQLAPTASDFSLFLKAHPGSLGDHSSVAQLNGLGEDSLLQVRLKGSYSEGGKRCVDGLMCSLILAYIF